MGCPPSVVIVVQAPPPLWVVGAVGCGGGGEQGATGPRAALGGDTLGWRGAQELGADTYLSWGRPGSMFSYPDLAWPGGPAVRPMGPQGP